MIGRQLYQNHQPASPGYTIATLANFSVDKLTTGTVDSAEKIVIDLHVRTVSRDLDLPVVYTVSSHLYIDLSTKDFGSSPGCACLFWNTCLHTCIRSI